jgi:hypothetical protein
MKRSEALKNIVFKSRVIVSCAIGPKHGTRLSYQTSKPTDPVPDKWTTDGDMVSSTTAVQHTMRCRNSGTAGTRLCLLHYEILP